LAEEKQLELIGSLAEQKRSEQAQSIARYMIGRPRTSLPSSGKSMFTHDDGTEETINDVVSVPMIHLEEVGYLGRIKTCIGLKTNYHVPNDPILRYVPYCEGVKGVIIDKCRYEKIEATIKRATCIEPKLELDEEIKECLLKEIVASFGATEQLFDTLKKLKPPVTYEDPASDYDRLKEMYLTRQGAMKQLLKLSQSPKNGVVRKLTSKLAIFEKHRVTDYLRPPISIFDSNLLKAPGCFGMRENSTYAEVAGSYSEIFCRLCYVYDCSMHGGQHPLPISRWDPVYPQAQYMPLKKHGIDTKAQEEIHRLGQLWYPTTATVSEGDASSNGSSLDKEDSGDYELSQEKDILLDLEQEEENDEEEDVEDHDDEDGEATDGDDFKTTTSLLEGRRRSERSQTRVSSLASAGLKIQLSMRDKRANCSKPPPKVKVHQLRAPYDSEYLDPTYIFTIGSTLKKIASPTEPCSSSCWKIEVMLPVASAMMWTKTEESILRKAITILEANACRLAVLFPARTCLEIYSFIQKEMAYQVKDKDFEEEEKNNEEEEVTVHSPSSIHKTQCGGRFRSNAKKKQSNRSIHQQREHSKRALLAEGGETCGYVPCDHIGPCLAGVCQCRKRNHLCSRACSCSRDCVYRLQGCTCLPGNCRTKACECFATDRECDPDFCLSCRACEIPLILRGDPSIQKKSSHSLGICNNVSLLRGLHKKIGMAFSTTHGYGAFALEPIEKDELVYEYTGALITDDEAERRGLLYDMTNMSFLFNVNKEYVVDAMRRGNKSKFANHNGNTPNCGAKIIRVVGDHRIALYAKKNIAKGEELFFDYGTTFHPTSNWEEAVNNKAKNDTNGDFNTPNIDLCGVAMKSSESVNMMTSATGISTPPKNSPVFLQQMNPFDVATNH
jgi:histone-lysine N-methyltransferase EZH2